MAFVRYRIVFSQQAQKYKIQYRDFFTLFLWNDIQYRINPGDSLAEAHQLDSKIEAVEQLEKLSAFDWAEDI